MHMGKHRRSSKRSRYIWKIVAGVCFTGGTIFAGTEPPHVKPETILSTSSYTADRASHTLLLIEVPISPLSDTKDVQFRRLHPGQGAFPNTAFVLIDSDVNHPNDRHVVWIRYVWENKAIMPAQIWSGTVTP